MTNIIYNQRSQSSGSITKPNFYEVPVAHKNRIENVWNHGNTCHAMCLYLIDKKCTLITDISLVEFFSNGGVPVELFSVFFFIIIVYIIRAALIIFWRGKKKFNSFDRASFYFVYRYIGVNDSSTRSRAAKRLYNDQIVWPFFEFNLKKTKLVAFT